MVSQVPLRSINYQWEFLLYRKNIFSKEDYDAKFSSKILSRNKNNKSLRVQFSVYVNNSNYKIFIVGEFNEWGYRDVDEFELTNNHDGFFSIVTDKIKHNDSYLFLIKKQDGSKQLLRDPASVMFDDQGNSVFWDFKDPKNYQMKYESPDTLRRTSIILQTDLLGLVARWFEFDENFKNLAESGLGLFDYIRKSGVLKKIQELGFNTIQFLPFTQSIDGDNWKFRYLVAFPFAIQKNWGDPNSFKKLIDECHKLGISVISDLIISHAPFKDFKIFSLRGEDVGISNWKDENNQDVFLNDLTPWGTKRFRYGDENVRRFLIESVLHFQKEYKIDGFRIDNVDGILRYGDNGQGEERPHGRQFLRELISQVYDFNPLALIHLESHYFFGDNAKTLVAPIKASPRNLGATAYNSSRLTYFFHKEFMPKAIEDISIWRFEQIREEKEWGKSNSTIADFHNHDAAAGLMEGRATGSYAYDALILKKPELHFHAVGKIKVMQSIIAFGCEGRILDLMQSYILQKGTFEHDSSIHWGLLKNPESKKLLDFKKRINHLITDPAFWPENTINRRYVNVDEKNKVLIIKREDKIRSSKNIFYCLINLSYKSIKEYAIGLEDSGSFEIVFNSDLNEEEFNNANFEILKSSKSNNFEVFPKEIVLKNIKPYQSIVVRKIKK